MNSRSLYLAAASETVPESPPAEPAAPPEPAPAPPQRKPDLDPFNRFPGWRLPDRMETGAHLPLAT